MKGLDTMPLVVEYQQMILHPYRAVYWQRENLLLVSDLHLGKIDHFRQAGIYVPSYASMDNYERLSSLLLEFQPKTLLILGDLFHSDYNYDWKHFSDLRQTFKEIRFTLVQGNHDILEKDLFLVNDIGVYPKYKRIPPFIFSHHPIDENQGGYNIAGHLHPGVRLIGDSKQNLKLPCFYFGKEKGILPAFGTFTGISLVYPKEEDQVVVITQDGLISVSNNSPYEQQH